MSKIKSKVDIRNFIFIDTYFIFINKKDQDSLAVPNLGRSKTEQLPQAPL